MHQSKSVPGPGWLFGVWHEGRHAARAHVGGGWVAVTQVGLVQEWCAPAPSAPPAPAFTGAVLSLLQPPPQMTGDMLLFP